MIPTLLAHLLFAYAALIEPILGVWQYQDLQQHLQTDQDARRRFYRRILLVEWAWVAVIGFILLPTPSPLQAIGLVTPQFNAWSQGDIFGFVLGLLIPILVVIVLVRKSPHFARRYRQMLLEPAAALLPATSSERRAWVAVALTAGICEELLFRGFLFFYLTQVFPTALPVSGVILISSAIFGLAHIYQGWKGVFGAGMGGLGLAFIYVFTGSLWPSMALHALIDLRVLILRRSSTQLEVADA